ncbi:MAG TPA: zf-HC2 domain-containing protein [Thermodesulfovibrionales bacterium]|nr:zf-HC2 domain-containing protein [Thermodesulfovibrionales bacterium]
MRSGHEEIIDLLPEYLKGSLPGELVNEVQAHLDGCEECRNEVSFLREIGESEVPDPGALFWQSLPRRVRLTVESKRNERFPLGFLVRRLPMGAAIAVALLLTLIYVYPFKEKTSVQDPFFKDPLTASVPDYSDVSEEDIPLIAEEITIDEAYLPRENYTELSYHKEFASLSSGEMESLYEVLKEEHQSGG